MPAAALDRFTASAAGHSAGGAIARHVVRASALHKLGLLATAATLAMIVAGGVFVSTLTADSPKFAPAASQPRDERQAFAKLQDEYTLAPGQVLRVIDPPFSPARTAWADAKFPYARGANRIRSIGLRWNGSTMDWSYMRYADVNLNDLLCDALNIPWDQVQGLDQVKLPPIHGDFVVRSNATRQQKLDALASLILDRTGQSVRFVHATRTIKCIVLHGKAHAAPKNARGFNVLVLAQVPLDDTTIKRWVNGWRPAGCTYAYSMDQASPTLGAPFFLADSDRERARFPADSGNLLLIAPDAKLNPADPHYEQKLRRVLDNVQKQIGGDWQIEPRKLDVWKLELVK